MDATRPSDGSTLIATLGGEPQVVTLVLDTLRARRHDIRHVFVIHTDPSADPTRQSLTRLRAELSFYDALDPPIRFQFIAIEREDGTHPTDVRSEADAGAVFRTLYRVALEAKRRGAGVHLCIAGGRKVMSVYGMAVAQMLFDERDAVWHILSAERLFAAKQMHPDRHDEVTLIPVPVLRWSSVAPVLTEFVLTEDPYQAAKRGQALRDVEATRRKREFLRNDLTDAERSLVELLVLEPMPNKQLARRLHRSPKTIANQLTSVYGKFSRAFRVVHTDRTVLIAEFSSLFTGHENS